MISDKIYQSIYDEISQYLHSGWEKLIVYLEYGVASYSFSFYIKTSDGYIKCFNLPGVSGQSLDESFNRINKMVMEERKKDTDSLWTNMTMIVSASGDFHVDYDYTDLTEIGYQHMKEWKKKYLI